MLLVLKSIPETRAEAIVTKFVLSAWPQFHEDHYTACICNVALTLHVAAGSPASVSELVLLGEQRYFSGVPPRPFDISHTLLDASNPITYSTNGAYRRALGSTTLSYYDGLPDVAVEDRLRLSALAPPTWPYVRFDVKLDRAIDPGHSAAVRFCFMAPGLFAAAEDDTLRFHLAFQSEFPLRQVANPSQYLYRVMPLLNVGSDGVAGGLDVFLYMPLELDGDDFTIEPIARLLPDYDHLGRRVSPPRLKFCWSGQMLRPHPGRQIQIGDYISLNGRFTRRHMATYNHFEKVNGDVFTGPVTASALSHAGSAVALPAANDPEAALCLLEQLQEILAREATGSAAELGELHVAAIEAAIRQGRFAQARQRLSALGGACKQMAEVATPILELIDHIGGMIK